MKRKKLTLLITVLVTALLFFLVGFGWWLWGNRPVNPRSSTSRIFVINRGESLEQIAIKLDQEGLVKSGLVFRLIILTQGLAGQVQAGDFRLKTSMTPNEIATVLTHGVLDIWLTFPEGWRREEFGRRLEANLDNFDYSGFESSTKDKEGFLFPDTYLVPQDASPAAVVKILTDNFAKKYHRDLKKAAAANGLTQKQVLVLASIVEREARHDNDRPVIAGILIKRWQNDWPLEADATLQYAKADSFLTFLEAPDLADFNWWPTARVSDKKIDSPFNTYLNRGLPPAPICNPGLASIEAVVSSQQTDYWFYIHDSVGKVHYARTNEEQNENINRYLR